jgi:hypothetical protein
MRKINSGLEPRVIAPPPPPHPSWGIDRPPVAFRRPERDGKTSRRRRVTADEIWAVIDADN